MNASGIVVSLMFFSAAASAQSAAQPSSASGSIEQREETEPTPLRFRASLGYFGEYFTHPGSAGSLEYSIVRWTRLELASSTQLGWYRHPRNHDALLLTQNLVGRVYCLWDVLHVDLMAGLGLFHRTPQGDVYSFEGRSTPVTRRVSSDRLGINTGFGLGLDAPRSLEVPLSLYFNAWASWEYPFNGYVLLHPIIEAGASFRF